MWKVNFTVRTTDEYGVFIDCDDRETADEFDDYLTEVLDLEISFIFGESITTFIMGESMTIERARRIVADFQARPFL